MNTEESGQRREGDTSRATVSPLRGVKHISVSSQSGTQLNPHYLWLTREYTLHLECGHDQVRARFPSDAGKDPQYLNPPLPRRARCRNCAPVPARGKRRTATSRANPTFDPLMAALVTDMYQAQPDQQDPLLEWIHRHGRYEPDEPRRHRAYAAVARVIADTYLPDTDNERADEVRTALEQWHQHPGEQTRTAVRTAAQRLYNTQQRDGSWYAHRGILQAAKLAAPHPHNVDAVTEAPTWDTATRRDWADHLWTARTMHDEHRAQEELAFRAGESEQVQAYAHTADEAARELTERVQNHQPRIQPRHMALCHAMLRAYQTAL